MTPQIGDIWDWNKDGDDEQGPVLLIQFSHNDNYWGDEITLHFIGLELMTGTYDDFIFNNGNMPYWKKLA